MLAAHAPRSRLSGSPARPVYVDPDELPLPTGKLAYSDPIGRVIGPLTGFLPEGEFEACLRIVTAVDPGAGVPGLPEWERIPTPGHTPGHVSYFRASDRVLMTGDALLTVNGSSLWGLLPLPGKRTISGPPRISTWNWAAATQSVARLEPRVLAPGHGTPMTTAVTAAALRSFSDSLASGPRVAPGFFRPVDYSRRTRYRWPPDMYLRLQPLGTLLTTAGISPGYVITLEVPRRRSGVIRRTTLVRVARDGGHYLVALAGESEWVRNVRAAGGRVVLGRRQRHAARLVEVPENERAPVIQAYLLRAGRRGSGAVTNEARYYFGLSAEPSLEEIGRIAKHYPVFRIVARLGGQECEPGGGVEGVQHVGVRGPQRGGGVGVLGGQGAEPADEGAYVVQGGGTVAAGGVHAAAPDVASGRGLRLPAVIPERMVARASAGVNGGVPTPKCTPRRSQLASPILTINHRSKKQSCDYSANATIDGR